MKHFKLLRFFITAVIASAVILVCSCEKEEKEWQITAEELPEAVLRNFNQSYPAALIKEYAAEVEDGQHYYEISCTFEGRKIDALYYPDGTIAAIEEVISIDQIPHQVKLGMESKFNNYSIKLAEKIQKEGSLFYEFKVLNKADKNTYELLFSDKGNLLEKSIIKKEDNEEDGEEND